MKRLYIIDRGRGDITISILRHGHMRRYKRPTPASLARARHVIRETIGK